MIKKIFMGLILLFITNSLTADEIKLGYLEISEKSLNTFSVLWKIPQKNGMALSLSVRFPESCVSKTTNSSQTVNNAILQYWYIHCPDNMIGQRISIEGMASSSSDVLLRFKWRNGEVATTLIKPSAPFYIVPEKNSIVSVAKTYLLLGVEHILSGIDHLLFVFALLLIVNGTRRLIMTVTSFTLAHSITLGAATLGFISVPQQPVEAVIALSILFLAVELVHSKHGEPGVAARWPWLIAFVFGLLHGFGFAGALAEVGLPQQSIPLALIFFNLGVETGQILFIVAVLIIGRLLHQLKQEALLKKAETIAIYSIGGISSLWLLERVSMF